MSSEGSLSWLLHFTIWVNLVLGKNWETRFSLLLHPGREFPCLASLFFWCSTFSTYLSGLEDIVFFFHKKNVWGSNYLPQNLPIIESSHPLLDNQSHSVMGGKHCHSEGWSFGLINRGRESVGISWRRIRDCDLSFSFSLSFIASFICLFVSVFLSTLHFIVCLTFSFLIFVPFSWSSFIWVYFNS